jgi:hypothetical protein
MKNSFIKNIKTFNKATSGYFIKYNISIDNNIYHHYIMDYVPIVIYKCRRIKKIIDYGIQLRRIDGKCK